MAKISIFFTIVLIIAAGIIAISARYHREINTAQSELTNLGSQVIETNCGMVEYASTGEGYPVLVIHGTFGGFDQGLLIAKPLINAGFRVIAVSRFGYLRSPMPENASVDHQADTYACLLDTLGIQQAAVLTVSGGAVSAIRFAVRYPERISALILQSPAAPGDVYVAPPPEFAFTMMRSNFVYWAMSTYMKTSIQQMIGVPKGFVVTPEMETEIDEILATTLPSSGRIDGFHFDNYDVTEEFYEQISETSPYAVRNIKTPVLIISAQDDPVAVHANVRSMAEEFPNAHLFVLPDGGHPLLGHAKEVNAEIEQFLNETVADSDLTRKK